LIERQKIERQGKTHRNCGSPGAPPHIAPDQPARQIAAEDLPHHRRHAERQSEYQSRLRKQQIETADEEWDQEQVGPEADQADQAAPARQVQERRGPC